MQSGEGDSGGTVGMEPSWNPHGLPLPGAGLVLTWQEEPETGQGLYVNALCGYSLAHAQSVHSIGACISIMGAGMEEISHRMKRPHRTR